MIRSLRYLAVWAGMSLLAFASAARADVRVALVIGNSTYQNTPALANPGNDADDTAAALQRVGFTVALRHDLDKRGMERAIAQFARDARDADVALFYYAGHGLQNRGLNYLMPTDAKLDDEFSLNFETTRLDDVLLSLNQSRGVKILILDACRSNPLADRLAGLATTRDFAGTRGLARLDGARGMVIAYSTQPDHLAVDGTGRNSPFTAALVKEIGEPGVEIGTMFRRVAADVNRATGGHQLPELSVSLLGDFYFSEIDRDVQAWAKVRTSQDAGQLKQFIASYPSSPLVADARERLDAIEGGAEKARLERERLQREQAERDRLVREQAERERLLREQLQREQAERERLEREQAKHDAPAAEPAPGAEAKAPAVSGGNIQTSMLSPPGEAPPKPPLTPPGSAGSALVLQIKKELNRVGCYDGPLDDKWPTSEITTSAKKFATYAKVKISEIEPTTELLNAIQEKPDRVCPMQCPAGRIEKEGRCIVKSCPAGEHLSEQGNCVGTSLAKQHPAATVEPVKPAATVPTSAPTGARPKSELSSIPSGEIRKTYSGGDQMCGQEGCQVVPKGCVGIKRIRNVPSGGVQLFC